MSNPQLEIITIEHESVQHEQDAPTDSRTETAKHHYSGAEAEIQVPNKSTKNGCSAAANDPHSSLLTVGPLKSHTHTSSTAAAAADVSNRQEGTEVHQLSRNSTTTGSTLIDIESGESVVEQQQQAAAVEQLQFSTSLELLQPQKKTSFEMNPSSEALVSNGSNKDNNNAPASTLLNSSAISTSQTNLVR